MTTKQNILVTGTAGLLGITAMKEYLPKLSEGLFENGLCLPSGSNLSGEDFRRIFGILDSLSINPATLTPDSLKPYL